MKIKIAVVEDDGAATMETEIPVKGDPGPVFDNLVEHARLTIQMYETPAGGLKDPDKPQWGERKKR